MDIGTLDTITFQVASDAAQFLRPCELLAAVYRP
jgi:hypothetical protein